MYFFFQPLYFFVFFFFICVFFFFVSSSYCAFQLADGKVFNFRNFVFFFLSLLLFGYTISRIRVYVRFLLAYTIYTINNKYTGNWSVALYLHWTGDSMWFLLNSFFFFLSSLSLVHLWSFAFIATILDPVSHPFRRVLIY